ncbi:MAG: beta-propeller fold lactonase family protein [Silvibacterium sp.]|nr:beta-propeller fold lactonase family protein [Silvibacterium sp.]
MKFKNFGRVVLALVVSLGLGFGITSCSTDFTAAFLYVTGSQYNQIGAFRVKNNTGNLTNVGGSPYGSGGTDPIRALISSTGRYLYVLNHGSSSADSSGNLTYSGENIAVFSVGGSGNLAFQQSYTSQGSGTIRMGFDSTGSYLYVLDEYMPQKNAAGQIVNASTTKSTAFPCPDPTASGIYRPTGALTAFSVDTNTGRLSLITNNQQTDSNGNQLSTFPVGCFPIDFKVVTGYVYVTDNGPSPTNASLYQSVFVYALNASNGQLTLTQNSELPTGATQISAINTDQANRYVYILDTGGNQIFYYTIGSNGVLQAVNGSPTANTPASAVNPVALTSDSKSKFLYVANAGPSSGTTNPNSQITAYTIAANGVLAAIASPNPITTGSGPQCILEDPSNQYIYTADSISNTVTGKVLDPNSGLLTDLRNKTDYATVGTPTWCVSSGHTD